MSRYFIDTNVFIYAIDKSAGHKQKTAQNIVLEAYRSQAVISPQVLHEYFVVATRKLAISAAIAQQHVRDMAELDQAIIDPAAVLRAIDCHRLNSISYWDALVVTCAAEMGCAYVLSEDMQNGQIINGVRIDNPFE